MSQGFYWAPVVEVKNEDAFMTRKMYGLLKAGNFINVPILMGINSEEMLFNNWGIFVQLLTRKLNI